MGGGEGICFAMRGVKENLDLRKGKNLCSCIFKAQRYKCNGKLGESRTFACLSLLSVLSVDKA